MQTYRLYCELPFGKLHRGNPKVVTLAGRLARSPSSIALKLVNFAHLDPLQRARGIRGMGNVSALDREVVAMFLSDWDAAAVDTELDRGDHGEELFDNAMERRETEGSALRKTRLTQHFFRAAVLAAYDGACCVCGICTPQLILASHIMPWASASAHRTNPRNGLALCALHDRAFDGGLLTVSPLYSIQVSSQIHDDVPVSRAAFRDVAGSQITLPSRFAPSAEFLTYHNENIFLA